jgi:hypothetical protein
MGVARFQIVHESDSRYYWQLINPHGTPTAAGSRCQGAGGCELVN